MVGLLSKYFPSATVFFKYFDRHPYVAYEGEEIKVPLSSELKGLDEIDLTGKPDYFIKVSMDEKKIELSNIMDGGEF